MTAAAVSIEADSERVDQLLKELEGKSIEEVIASGVSKLASVPAGGGGGGGAAAAGGGGAAAAGWLSSQEEIVYFQLWQSEVMRHCTSPLLDLLILHTSFLWAQGSACHSMSDLHEWPQP